MVNVDTGRDLFCEPVHVDGGVVTEIAARLDVEKHFHCRHLAPYEERFPPVREWKFEPLETGTLDKKIDEILDGRVLRQAPVVALSRQDRSEFFVPENVWSLPIEVSHDI